MIKTSNAYKECIQKNRRLHHKAEITFANGKSETVEDLDFFVFQIQEGTSNTGSFDIGAAVAKQLTIKLDNSTGRFDDYDFSEASITAKVGLELPDGKIEWLNKGIYTAEPGEDSGDTIAVSAFDYMARFDIEYSISKLSYPATLGQIVRDACSCCGVEMATDITAFDNDDFIVQTRPEDSVTFRQVLQWVGQIACRYCIIDYNGKFTLHWYDTSTLESTWVTTEDTVWMDVQGNTILDVDGNEIGTIIEKKLSDGSNRTSNIKLSDIVLADKNLSGSSVKTDDVVITGIKVTEENDPNDDSNDEEEDNPKENASEDSTETVYRSGTDGYVLEISDNKLIQGGSGATVASYLGERLNGLQFRPLSINIPGNPAIEGGDLGLVISRRGKYYKTIFTNVTYTANTAQSLVCDAEAPTRKSSTRYSQATKVYKELRNKIQKHKKAWDAAFDSLNKAMESKNGLFPIEETLEDGSTILYFCDKPVLEDAQIVVKFSAAGWAMSTDGGKNWNIGALVDGTMITKILNTIGINAKWINAGSLSIKDEDENIILEVDMEKKSVYINGDTVHIGNTALGKKLSDMDENIANARNMTLQLSNEYQAISVDAEGNYSEFPSGITTKPTVMYGSKDITADCTYTVTKSEGVAGTWNNASKIFTATGLISKPFTCSL